MKISDKNKIFEFLNGSSYSLNDFKIIEKVEIIISNGLQDKIPTITITYKDTPLKFEISNPFESFDQYRFRYIIYGPNLKWSNQLPKDQVGYFHDVISGFQFWLDKQVQPYTKELTQIDLWEEYLKAPGSVTFDINSKFDTSLFTEGEKEQLKLALGGLKTLIIEKFTETQLQIDLVSQNINYLVEKVDHLNKFDWRGVAISILINICTSLMLDPQKAKIIWNWFVNLISTIRVLPI